MYNKYVHQIYHIIIIIIITLQILHHQTVFAVLDTIHLLLHCINVRLALACLLLGSRRNVASLTEPARRYHFVVSIVKPSIRMAPLAPLRTPLRRRA